MIKTKTVTYSELAKQVNDMVLFNQLNTVDYDWMYGFIVSPLLQQKIEKDDEELAKEHGISPEELGEHSAVPEHTSIYDYAESIYQTFIIDDSSALWLYNNTSEIISYSEKLDSFFWHVCHFGTSWSGVHAEIRDDSEDGDNDIWDVTKLANMTHG